jgi:hypothetical protein
MDSLVNTYYLTINDSHRGKMVVMFMTCYLHDKIEEFYLIKHFG